MRLADNAVILVKKQVNPEDKVATMHNMEAYRGVEVQLHSFLTKAQIEVSLKPQSLNPLVKNCRWDPELTWTFRRRENSLTSSGCRTPDYPASRLVVILTDLTIQEQVYDANFALTERWSPRRREAESTVHGRGKSRDTANSSRCTQQSV